jgi:hypothetical protein
MVIPWRTGYPVPVASRADAGNTRIIDLARYPNNQGEFDFPARTRGVGIVFEGRHAVLVICLLEMDSRLPVPGRDGCSRRRRCHGCGACVRGARARRIRMRRHRSLVPQQSWLRPVRLRRGVRKALRSGWSSREVSRQGQCDIVLIGLLVLRIRHQGDDDRYADYAKYGENRWQPGLRSRRTLRSGPFSRWLFFTTRILAPSGDGDPSLQLLTNDA